MPLWHRLRKCFIRRSTTVDGKREPIVRQSEQKFQKAVLRDSDFCKVHKSPRGYPKLAAFLDSDDNFMVFRRFGYLQSRLLLEKQDDLRLLETQLDKLDQADARNEPESLMTREVLEDDDARPQAELLGKIEKKFCEYCTYARKSPTQICPDRGSSATLLTSAQALTSLNKPSTGEYRSVEAWINNIKPCYNAEHSFIYRKEDLVTLRPGREHAWLDSSVESLLRVFNCKSVEVST